MSQGNTSSGAPDDYQVNVGGNSSHLWQEAKGKFPQLDRNGKKKKTNKQVYHLLLPKWRGEGFGELLWCPAVSALVLARSFVLGLHQGPSF